MTSATDELLVTGYPNSLRPELHKALKARGIDYWLAQGITFWNRDDGCECLAYGYKVNGVPKLAIKVVGFTDPEQAIAATLGSCNVGRYVGLRQGEYWERTENSNYYCGGCGWKVTDHDSYCPECGGALHEYALGTETCHEVMINRHWRGCGECGYVWENMYGEGFQIGPNYCPMCGKRVKKVAE